MQSIAEQASEIYRRRVLRAREMDPVEKMLEGPRLFEMGCRIMKMGIRHQVEPERVETEFQPPARARPAAGAEGALLTGDEATAAVVAALGEHGIPFMLVGSLSRNFYAFPRSTKDADIVIHCAMADAGRLIDALPPGIIADPQVTFETVTGTLRHILSLDESEFKIEIFHLSDDAHDRERFERRAPVEMAGSECFIPTAEDVIVQKIRWCRDGRRTKDYDDARDVMAVQGRALDFGYIRDWTSRHGTRAISTKSTPRWSRSFKIGALEPAPLSLWGKTLDNPPLLPTFCPPCFKALTPRWSRRFATTGWTKTRFAPD